MKIASHLVSLFLTMFIVFSAVACAPCAEVALNNTLNPTISLTVAPTAAPTATSTAIPTPTTEEYGFTEERRIELNQQFHDFLNKQGEFSQENMDSKLLYYNNARKTLDLGWINGDEAGVALQTYFFDYFRSGDYIIVAVGLNGTDGNNHVKPMVIPINYFKENNPSVKFAFTEMGDWNTSTSYRLIWESNAGNIVDRLNKIKGNFVILDLYTKMSDEIIKNGVCLFGNGCEPYLNEFKNTNNLVNGLMSDVSATNNERILGRDAVYDSSVDSTVPDIKSVDDLMSVDISKAPRIFMISSNLW